MKFIIKYLLIIGLILGIMGCSSEDIATDTSSVPESHESIVTQDSNEVIDTVVSSEDESILLSDASPYDIPAIDESPQQVYLDAINSARAVQQDCGVYGIKDPVPALAWSDALYKAAYEHSQDMAESDTFSHDGSGTESDWTAQVLNLERGSTMSDRVGNNGYTNWNTLAENIAAGSTRDTAQEVIDAWIDSDGHCLNLMNPAFKDVGMGHAEKYDSAYTHYWTQNFGAE